MERSQMTTSRLNWLFSVLGCLFLAVLTMWTQRNQNLEFGTFIDNLFNQVSVFTLTGLFRSDLGLLTTSGKLVFLISIIFGMLTTSFVSILFVWIPRHRWKEIAHNLQNPRLVGFLVEDLIFLWGSFASLFYLTGLGKISVTAAIFNSLSALANDGVTWGTNNAVPFADCQFLILTWSFAILVGGLGLPARARFYRWVFETFFGRNFQRFIPTEMVGEKWYVESIVFVTLFVKVMGTIIMYDLERDNLSPLLCFFHVVSSSTAGFNAVDLGSLSNTTHWLIMALMFIGAAPNSWGGGGFKVFTFLWVVYAVFTVTPVKIKDKNSEKVQSYSRESLVRIGISTLIIFFSLQIGLVFQPNLDQFKFLFEVVSAFSNTGYSLGLTTQLTVPNMVNLMFIMLIGKIGVISSLYALAPSSEQKLTKSGDVD
jgi:trk system potassium uptake protein